MRRRQLYLSLCSALLLLFICWGTALSHAQWLTKEYTGISIRLTSGSVSAKTLNAMLEQGEAGALHLTAWTRSEQDITIDNEALGTQVQARRIAVCGDMAEVCPMALLRGALPPSIDEGGCVIDDAVAIGLFRNLDVIGAAIELDGQSYTVRAVVRGMEPMILLRDENAGYENFELTFSGVERAGTQAKDFLYRHGVADQYVVIENGFYAKLVSGLAELPGILAAATILIAIIRQVWRRRTIPLQLTLLLIATAVGFFLLKWLLNLNVYWPDRFLPTRWSDFAFWSDLLEEQRDYFSELAFLLPVPKDMQWQISVRGMLVSVTGSVLAILYLLVKGKTFVETIGVKVLICVFCCLIAATGTLHFTDNLFTPSSGFLYAVPLLWLFESRNALRKEICYGFNFATKHRKGLRRQHCRSKRL